MFTDSSRKVAVRRPSDTNIFKRISLDELKTRVEGVVEELILREFSATGDFLDATTASPGNVTVLSDDSTFTDVLLGKTTPRAVSIRLGAHECRPGEVHVVKTADVVSSRVNVWTTLNEAGCSELTVNQALHSFGLDECREMLPKDLDEGSAWILAVACAMYSKYKVVILDQPFRPLGTKWREQLASLIAAYTEQTERIVVITRIGDLPLVWEHHPSVKREETSKSDGKTTRIGIRRKTSEDLIQSARSMMRGSRAQENQKRLFTTRAHSISSPRGRVAVPDALQTETIINPAIDELTRAQESVGRVRQSLTDAPVIEGRIAKRHDTLTGVTPAQRVLYRYPWLRLSRTLKQKLEGIVYEWFPSGHILPAKRVSYMKKRSRFWTYVPPLLAILFLMLALSWIRIF